MHGQHRGNQETVSGTGSWHASLLACRDLVNISNSVLGRKLCLKICWTTSPKSLPVCSSPLCTSSRRKSCGLLIASPHPWAPPSWRSQADAITCGARAADPRVYACCSLDQVLTAALQLAGEHKLRSAEKHCTWPWPRVLWSSVFLVQS